MSFQQLSKNAVILQVLTRITYEKTLKLNIDLFFYRSLYTLTSS